MTPLLATVAGPQPEIFGVPIEFLLFASVLVGVAMLHTLALQVAVTGLVVITTYKLLFSSFTFAHVSGGYGFLLQLEHEWVILLNLLGLLLGFEILAQHFTDSRLPSFLPKVLPSGKRGGFTLLVLVFVISSFLDNIGAAMIGATAARAVYRDRLHVGYLAAIVAASNAGGSGSVVGDTTTTMMWIAGVGPLEVVHAYGAAVIALVVTGIIATMQQERYQPIGHAEPPEGTGIDWGQLGVVVAILAGVITANVIVNTRYPALGDSFPWIGAAVWTVILLGAIFRRPDWSVLPSALRGSAFLLSLVLSASMMPVERLPAASPTTAFGLGVVSAVFDNIPLTKLALDQGGYDWGVLAYSVGFGGSMIWFGSSAGVAVSNRFAEARSVKHWLANGWHVSLAYVIGFITLSLTLGWSPGSERLRNSRESTEDVQKGELPPNALPSAVPRPTQP